MSKFDITTAYVLPDHRTITPEQRLEETLSSLRNQIAKSPKLSHTAERARRLIANLEAPDCSFSTETKIAAVREALRNYAGSRHMDNILHHPGDRKPKRGGMG